MMASTLEQIDSGQIEVPLCDFHKLYGQKVMAIFFGPTTEGIIAYMCTNCHQDFSVGKCRRLGEELE